MTYWGFYYFCSVIVDDALVLQQEQAHVDKLKSEHRQGHEFMDYSILIL